MMTHDEIQSLLPGYAIGALDAEEARAVRSHLRGCNSCRRELAGYERVGDALALSAASVQPPAALEEKIMRAARALRPPRRRFIMNPGLAAAAALVIAVLAGGNVAQWVRSPDFRARTTGLITIQLVGVGATRDAYGTIIVETGENEGVLAVRGLPRLDPSQRYQLWLRRDGERKSGGVFSVGDDGYGSLLIKVPGGFRGFSSFGITVEPAEGSLTPTTPPVLRGSL
jgi:anti-sigma-K factor RskA